MRREHDFYATPEWCVHRLVEWLTSKPERESFWRARAALLEPCVGDGAMVRALPGYRWHVNDLVDRPLVGVRSADIRSRTQGSASPWIRRRSRSLGSLLLSNPPNNRSLPIVAAAVESGLPCFWLMPAGWRFTAERHAFMAANPLRVLADIPDRISFTGEGSPSQPYSWHGWNLPFSGIVTLELTPRTVRAAAERNARERAAGLPCTRQRRLF